MEIVGSWSTPLGESRLTSSSTDLDGSSKYATTLKAEVEWFHVKSLDLD